MKKISRKLVLGLLSVGALQAEVTTVLPYFAMLDYGNKSAKDSGTINGVYLSTGTLTYLVEMSYAHTDIKYKNKTKNLKQDEATFIYNKYFTTSSIKAGIHTNSTTDIDLQNGNTYILGASKWKWFGYSKATFGLDYYQTLYANGKDLQYINKSVTVKQLTPFFSFYKPFKTLSNLFSLKYNLENIDAYSKKNYNSFELKDTIYYKKASLELSYFGGEMRTGIKDNGMTVYNSKDLIKNSIGAKVGYSINKKLSTTLAYSANKFDEFGNSKDTKNSVVVATISYTF